MLTAAQIAKLEELGFKGNNRSNWDKPSNYSKYYGFDVYIHVFTDATTMFHMIRDYQQAQRDLEELRKVGIK